LPAADAQIHAALVAATAPDRVWRHAALAPLTTFKVGGSADWLVEPRGAEELCRLLAAVRALELPRTMIGGGSNVLIGDRGVRGVAIRPRGGEARSAGPNRVSADAALTINGLVRWTVAHGCAGLEAWAGTPGTVGGGIYGNAHYGGRLLGELVESVQLVNASGAVQDLPASAMEFGYDRSRLQRTHEVLLSATFRTTPGEPETLRATARASLAFRKRTQPLDTPSAGCIFQNPDAARETLPPGVPASAGALVDRAGLKGRTIGGARVSPTHGNFIVNDGSATAREIRALIDLCRDEVRRQFGVELREEIVYLGEF
jgi:UDP-N-acetylmuramate dehydrogenase